MLLQIVITIRTGISQYYFQDGMICHENNSQEMSSMHIYKKIAFTTAYRFKQSVSSQLRHRKNVNLPFFTVKITYHDVCP